MKLEDATAIIDRLNQTALASIHNLRVVYADSFRDTVLLFKARCNDPAEVKKLAKYCNDNSLIVRL